MRRLGRSGAGLFRYRIPQRRLQTFHFVVDAEGFCAGLEWPHLLLRPVTYFFSVIKQYSWVGRVP